MKKILIINPFGIGDVLFTAPVIHTLKDAYPGLKIGYLCNRRTAGILRTNPFVDSVYEYERDEFEAFRRLSFFTWLKKHIGFLSRIKAERFEAVLDFSLNSQFAFFSWYAGIKKRIGYDFKKRGWLLTHKIDLASFQEKHIIEYYNALLKFLDLGKKYNQPELYLDSKDLKSAEETLRREIPGNAQLLVGIVPGAGRSWGREAYFKHWPADRFAQVADKLVENYHAQIIILGDSAEQEICRAVSSRMRNKPVDLCGKTNLGELSAIISRLNLVITNDGGPLHMAVALKVKTVSIFGPVDEMVYGPYPPSGRHIVVSNRDVTCRPCYRSFRLANCVSNRRCIEDISVDEVFSAAKELI